MSVETYGRWPWCAAAMVGPAWALVARDRRRLRDGGGWVAGLLMEAANVGMHLGVAARRRRYNPGTATAALLMAPHAALGARELLRSRRLSRRGGLLAASTGIAFAGLPALMRLRMRRSGN